MANEDKKNFNAMLENNKNMPKIVTFDNAEAVKKWGGKTMVIAPPKVYDNYIKQVPLKKLVTTLELRKIIAKQYKTDITCPLTAGIFVNICAWASYQRQNNITPYWRVLKTGGELNPKFPSGVLGQKQLLEKEGFKIIEKGKTNKKYFVKDYQDYIYNF